MAWGLSAVENPAWGEVEVEEQVEVEVKVMEDVEEVEEQIRPGYLDGGCPMVDDHIMAGDEAPPGRHRGSEGLAAARALHTCKGDIDKSPFPSKLSRVQCIIEEANPTGLCRPRR